MTAEVQPTIDITGITPAHLGGGSDSTSMKFFYSGAVEYSVIKLHQKNNSNIVKTRKSLTGQD